MATKTPRIGEGPGLDSQGSAILFHKHCFPNLLWIHGKTIEEEDFEFVSVLHPRKWVNTEWDLWEYSSFFFHFVFLGWK